MTLFAANAEKNAGRLPIWPRVGDDGSSIAPPLPLALFEPGGGETGRSQGTSGPATLALRLFVEAVLNAPSARPDRPVRLSVSLRGLLAWAYPNDRYGPMDHLLELNRAVEALDSREARVAFGGQNGRLRELRVVSVSDVPRSPEALADLITLIVCLPPGTGLGPSPDRERLQWWGVRNGHAYTALLGLAYAWHRPGITVFPLQRSGRDVWVRSDDPSDYDPLTPDQIVDLVFPGASAADRSLLERAREILDALVRAGDCRYVEDRVLPPASTEPPA